MSDLSRPTRSAAEIAALPLMGTTQCMAYVRANGHTLTPETLVYITREAITAGDSPLVQICTRFITGREIDGGHWQGGFCEGTITTLASKYRLNSHPDLIRAFRARCFEGLWKALFAGRVKKPFYEVNFAYAFWQQCIDAKRSLVRSGGRDMEAGIASGEVNAVDVDDIVLEEVEPLDDKIIKKLTTPLHEAALLAAIRALPQRQAHAALLAWVEQLPIEGGQDTVSSMMGVSPRRVYALLAKARLALQSDPAVLAIWAGEA